MLAGLREGRPIKDQMARSLNLGDPRMSLKFLEINSKQGEGGAIRNGRDIWLIMISTSSLGLAYLNPY